MKWLFSMPWFVILGSCGPQNNVPEFIRLEQRNVEWTKELELQQWKNHEEYPELMARNSVFSDSLTALLATYDDAPKTSTDIRNNISEHKHKALMFMTRHPSHDKYEPPGQDFLLSYEFLNANYRVSLSHSLQANMGNWAQRQHTYACSFEPIVMAQRNGIEICGSTHLGCLFHLPTLTLQPLTDSGNYELTVKPIFYYCRPNIQPYMALDLNKPIQKLTKCNNGTYTAIPLQMANGADSNSYTFPLQTMQKSDAPCE